MILNSKIGKTIFEKAKYDLEIIECVPKDMWQEPLYKPCKKPEEREKFWNDYNSLNFEKIIKKYARDNCKVRIKRMLKRVLHKGGKYDKFKVNR